MDFANSEVVQKIVERLYPDAEEVSLVTHGYDNIVALVDKQYAIRFPQSDGAYARSRYEQQVLKDLDSLSVVTIPKILGSHHRPSYLITSFVAGTHLSSSEVNKLTIYQQKEIGQQVAKLAWTMHSLLSVEQALVLRKEYHLDNQIEEPWDKYFKKLLYDNRLPTNEQDAIAKHYYDQWLNLTYITPLVVLHDDLHTQNMLFEDGQLVGVLDFGDTNIGHPEQELRQLYRINEEILDAAATTYEKLSGWSLNREAIKIWAIMQELALYSELYAQKDQKLPGFTRAGRNLSNWLGQDIWLSEDDMLNELASGQ